MFSWWLVVLYGYVIGSAEAITIRKVCPMEEVHKSCTFYEEYICWVTDTRLERVITSPKRLSHCKSGCFCKKGYVRDYPGGGCIIAAGCQDQQISAMLGKLPVSRGLHTHND